MSDNIKNQNSDLFIVLSEQEQEAVSGGFFSNLKPFRLVFNKIDIETYASQENNISVGDIVFNNKQETRYKFSQINLKFRN
ncbi:hypothetical protein Cylst_1680 [Cylindrospermum stagnale PCC 7417]|uniref:Uncharacterized protein n=1 Tax=Cylindrospermum stagnale PCC 7417 TaxID=56107 RepID=K9WWQ0_9NOST|nr:hypothetical protein [Cylindrospermum stagnale]AFZ23952.1 hypothetical protein Cylst_1680 [Cylindrospermum stagnale PCC 7417]